MKEALAMVARVAEAQKAGESNPEALADLQKSLASLAEDNEDIAKMLESMGVPVQVADDGSTSIALTGALDLDRLSESLKGEVKKVKQEEKKQARIVGQAQAVDQSRKLQENKIAATKALEAVAKAKRQGDLDPESV